MSDVHDLQREFEDLLSAMTDGSLSDAGRRRINEILSLDDDFCRQSIAYFQMHALLLEEHGALSTAMLIPSVAEPVRMKWRSWTVVLAAAAAAVLIAAVSILRQPEAKHQVAVPTRGEAMASVSHLVGTTFVYGIDNRPVTVGDTFGAGRYEMTAGIVELVYPSGVELIIQAPAIFNLDRQDKVTLTLGRLAANVPEAGVGFTVLAGQAEVIDLGTKFVVDVPGAEFCEVHVFDGEVLLNTGADNDAGVKSLSLKTGEAMRVFQDAGEPAGIDLANDRYVRTLADIETPYAAIVKELNPVLYFPMHISPDGWMLLDKSGNGLNAGIMRPGALIWAPGKIDTAIELSGRGAGGFAVVEDYPKSTSNQISVSAWVYAESRPMWASIMKNWGDGTRTRGQFHFGLHGRNGQLEVHIIDKPKEKFAVDTEPLPLHQWHHVAFVADGQELRLYRNGRVVGSTDYSQISGNPDIKALSIGAKLSHRDDQKSPGQKWHGRLDEMALFNYALDESEIKMLFEAGR